MEYKIDTAARVDIRLELSGSGVTSLTVDDLTVKWADFNSTAWETLTKTTHFTLVELGEGDYILTILAGVIDTAGPMRVKVSSGSSAFTTVQYIHHAVAALTTDVVNAGSGANTITITTDDGSSPLASTTVRVYAELGMTTLLAQGTTGTLGTVTFYLDNGTYYVQNIKAGYSFTLPETLTVSGDTSDTYSGTAVSQSGTTLATLQAYARMRIAGSTTSSATTMINTAINNALKRVGREDFYEFLRPGRINLVAKYNTGTVSASNDSAVITGSGTAWQTAGVTSGDKVIISGDTNVELEVLTVDSETQITALASQKWVSTSTSGASYTIYRDSYAIPNATSKEFRKMFQPEGEDFGIDWVSPQDFYEAKMVVKNWSNSDPSIMTVINTNFQIYPYPTTARVIDYLYYAWPKELSLSTDSIDLSEHKLPLLHRAIDLELSLFPGVDLNPVESEAMYERFLEEALKADKKAWRKWKIRNPHHDDLTYPGVRRRYPYGDVTIS